MNMLEKFLNKEVVIEEKLYATASTLSISKFQAPTYQNKLEGIITAIDDEFIELDNNALVARKFIYRITLK